MSKGKNTTEKFVSKSTNDPLKKFRETPGAFNGRKNEINVQNPENNEFQRSQENLKLSITELTGNIIDPLSNLPYDLEKLIIENENLSVEQIEALQNRLQDLHNNSKPGLTESEINNTKELIKKLALSGNLPDLEPNNPEKLNEINEILSESDFGISYSNVLNEELKSINLNVPKKQILNTINEILGNANSRDVIKVLAATSVSIAEIFGSNSENVPQIIAKVLAINASALLASDILDHTNNIKLEPALAGQIGRVEQKFEKVLTNTSIANFSLKKAVDYVLNPAKKSVEYVFHPAKGKTFNLIGRDYETPQSSGPFEEVLETVVDGNHTYLRKRINITVFNHEPIPAAIPEIPKEQVITLDPYAGDIKNFPGYPERQIINNNIGPIPDINDVKYDIKEIIFDKITYQIDVQEFESNYKQFRQELEEQIEELKSELASKPNINDPKYKITIIDLIKKNVNQFVSDLNKNSNKKHNKSVNSEGISLKDDKKGNTNKNINKEKFNKDLETYNNSKKEFEIKKQKLKEELTKEFNEKNGKKPDPTDKKYLQSEKVVKDQNRFNADLATYNLKKNEQYEKQRVADEEFKIALDNFRSIYESKKKDFEKLLKGTTDKTELERVTRLAWDLTSKFFDEGMARLYNDGTYLQDANYTGEETDRIGAYNKLYKEYDRIKAIKARLQDDYFKDFLLSAEKYNNADSMNFFKVDPLQWGTVSGQFKYYNDRITAIIAEMDARTTSIESTMKSISETVTHADDIRNFDLALKTTIAADIYANNPYFAITLGTATAVFLVAGQANRTKREYMRFLNRSKSAYKTHNTDTGTLGDLDALISRGAEGLESEKTAKGKFYKLVYYAVIAGGISFAITGQRDNAIEQKAENLDPVSAQIEIWKKPVIDIQKGKYFDAVFDGLSYNKDGLRADFDQLKYGGTVEFKPKSDITNQYINPSNQTVQTGQGIPTVNKDERPKQ